jgi:hypothetical protein
VKNLQNCGTFDPTAYAAVSLGQIQGDSLVGATAIANNLSIANDGAPITVDFNHQVNSVPVYAQVDAQVHSTNGDFEVNATAVGNNLSIKSIAP